MASGFRGDNGFHNPRIPFSIANVPRPRAPPRLIRPPSPLCMEVPRPMVPDVSLIIDSAATSFQSNPDQSYDQNRRSGSPPPRGGSNNVPSRFAFPRTSGIRSGDNSENTPSMNLVNYYPTPSPNNTRSGTDLPNSQSHSHSLSKQDSGNGGSPEEYSRTRSRQSTNDDTSISEHLPFDESNISGKLTHSLSTSGYESLKADIVSVSKTVKLQTDSIEEIKIQLQKIVDFQEKFLVHVIKKGSGVSQGVQTDDLQMDAQRRSSPVLEGKGQSDSRSASSQSKRPTVPFSEPVVPPPVKRTSPTLRQELLKSKVTAPPPPQPPPSEDSKKVGGGEDLSAILRSLQISNVQHPSTYSDTSMKSLEFPPFTEETFHNENNSSIGPSVSAQESDLEEDSSPTMLPSVTYYNNLLSTVNRVLDGGQQPPPNPEIRPSSAASSRKSERSVKTVNQALGVPSHSQRTVSYSSATSSSSSSGGSGNNNAYRRDDFKENVPRGGASDANSLVNRFLDQQKGAGQGAPKEDTVESTKRYLQSLGVQFDNPANPGQTPTQPLSQKQNYMIQQNVYNSIYIPTVNCVPVISESLNSNSGLIDNLARKYIPSGERNQYELMAGRTNEAGGALAETTVYGMTPGNLSFATKEYLKRHGLVGNSLPAISPPPGAYHHNPALPAPPNEKVLDMTAIRNQPKLL